MKKTKIVCSIGPASCNYDIMKKMILSGMNVARINFSHGSYSEREEIIRLVNKINEELNTHVAILFDTKGPDLRTEEMKNGEINLIENKHIRIVNYSVLGTEDAFSVNYKEVIDCLKINDILLIDDGYLTLKVISKELDGVTCEIIHGGILKNKKSINVPDCCINLPFISDVDNEDIKYSCSKNGDYLALSFVSCKEDIIEVRKLVNEYGNPSIQIISKIESKKAIDNLDEIIEYSDGIMVARGDLGVELSLEKIPMLQKEIVSKCRNLGKECIVATDMLASMVDSPKPTRAEVTDVANAIIDGTDAIMLSAESGVGRYPVEAVQYMNDICLQTESNMDYDLIDISNKEDITGAIARSVIDIEESLNAKLIVTPSISGYTARKVSNLRPRPLVLAPVPNEKVARSLALCWGVYPVITNIMDNSTDIIINAKQKAREFMNFKERDIIVITGGIPAYKDSKVTTLIKVEEM